MVIVEKCGLLCCICLQSTVMVGGCLTYADAGMRIAFEVGQLRPADHHVIFIQMSKRCCPANEGLKHLLGGFPASTTSQ